MRDLEYQNTIRDSSKFKSMKDFCFGTIDEYIKLFVCYSEDALYAGAK